MAFKQRAVRLAIRSWAQTVSVCTTGSISLAASGRVFTRTTGSFFDDKFAVGMEVLAAGFASTSTNQTAVITDLSDLTMTIDRTLVTEAAASGRSLSVGLPSSQSWENDDFEPTSGAPYIVEQFTAGPTFQATSGAPAGGQIECRPQYGFKIFVPQNVGSGAADAYADALCNLFTPRTAITVGSDTLRVRTDVGPFRGQLLPSSKSGWSYMPVTFSFWLRTANTI